ncbi:MAG: glycine zipper domain-containing protein [Pirellulaceae bacterium]|nr:glycine zipper domain-containing protein [Pirellulaceae bacterium]
MPLPRTCAAALIGLLVLGCRSPYYADRGALLGGLTGAGVGAALGDATGNAGPGAVIGTAVGALTGAAIGEGIDADLARSQAEIQARMGKQLQGAVTSDDVIAMTRAGLSEDVIATHIRASGVAKSPDVNDLIYLRNQGVSDNVIKTLQQTPPPQLASAVPVYPAARGPVVVEHVYPAWYPPPPACPPVGFSYRHWGRRHGWGVSVWP